jgi:dTDP-4-dehydrorhamnose reductase
VTQTCIIFGANGQMGKACLKAMENLNFDLVPLSKTECDVTNLEDLKKAFETHLPSLVVNAAAFTNVDASETAQAQASALNAAAPADIARLCSRHSATLIHLSTDYVFGDCGSPPLDETAATQPLNHYGQSKLDGEIAIRKETNRHVILRTSWIFSAETNNFFRTIMTLSERLETIRVVNDETSCPTFANDLANVIAVIARRCLGPEPIFGTWHACGREGINRFDFAAAIIDARRTAGVRVPKLLPLTQHEFGAAARRPRDSRMTCTALERDFSVSLASFRQHLDPCVKEMLALNGGSSS